MTDPHDKMMRRADNARRTRRSQRGIPCAEGAPSVEGAPRVDANGMFFKSDPVPPPRIGSRRRSPVLLASLCLSLLWCGSTTTPVAGQADASNQASKNSTQSAPSSSGAPGETTTDETAEPVVAWDYSPYRIQVWLSIEPQGAIPPKWRKQIERTILNFAEPAAGVTWDLHITEPPDHLKGLVVRALDKFAPADIQAVDLVIAVNEARRKAKEIDVKRTADLLGDGLRVGVPDPTACRTGLRVRAALGSELGDKLFSRPGLAVSPNSVELAAQVAAGELDAAICCRVDAAVHGEAINVVDMRWEEDSRRHLDGFDKLVFVNVHADSVGFRIETRELDGPMRFLGPIVRHEVRQPELLGHLCAVSVAQAFSPVARIEERFRTEEMIQANKDAGRKDVIDVRVRAGGLIRRTECVSDISKGDVLLPIVRRNDRYGDPSYVEPVAYTFLQVHELQGTMADCDIHSGISAGIRAKRSGRTQQIAIKSEPRPRTTTVFLTSRDRFQKPMIGYEIHVKDLETGDMSLIGYSDWRGGFAVPPDERNTLRLLYIKNGGFVMAKVPVVPGLFDELKVMLVDDERRLEAEAFIKQIETLVLDTVSRSKLLEARIGAMLAQGKVAEAEEALKELNSLPTRDDIKQMINLRELSLKDPVNKSNQNKIDKMLTDTRELLVKFMDDTLVERMTTQIRQAQQK